jgi:hypothetical protein
MFIHFCFIRCDKYKVVTGTLILQVITVSAWLCVYNKHRFPDNHKYHYPVILRHLLYLFKNCRIFIVISTFPSHICSSPKVSCETQYCTTFLCTRLYSIPQLTACRNAWLALMVVVMNITVFWDVMSCTMITSQQCYTETCCHHLQFTRIIEVAHSSEIPVTSHQSTWHHVLEDIFIFIFIFYFRSFNPATWGHSP